MIPDNCQWCKCTLKEYGIFQVDNRKIYICHSCCAEDLKRRMKRSGCAVLYFDKDVVKDVTGKFSIPIFRKRFSETVAGTRLDVWFNFNGRVWRGSDYNNCNRLNCRQTKQMSVFISHEK